jgi:hypothetical protein
VDEDNRKQHRIGVSLQVRIRGKDRGGKPFDEMTHSDDLIRGGCSFHTTHELAVGAEVDVEIYRHIRSASPFITRGVVLRATPADPGQFAVGVRFTGPHFPIYTSETTTNI